MNGKDLLAAMSYVDDRLVDEAEYAGLSVKSSRIWIRLAAIAACLCLIIGGMSVSRGRSGATEGIQETLAGNTDREEAAQATEAGGASPQETAAEAQMEQVSCVVVCIDEWTEDGFMGTVQGTADPELLPVGLRVHAVLEDWQKDQTLAEGVWVIVRFSAFDQQEQVLYVESLTPVE